ncbi:glycosyltransferase [Nibribacter ruber]|uniref:Glycosyltransferase n=1 Tax=Nibribacter ruber TaxID=2698458 RepID=A0A6P1P3Y4_9BACT|nr:glycosyltransferase family 2 protein [Nibribacter ruber]QHL89093.1 glycosyltransferase [Nibribacter ruber]
MSKTVSPKISVVIPLYNKGAYIAATLQSVLRQTFPSFEVIIVDDGSTDQGPAVVETFQDSRLRIVHQSNLGVSAARNQGIRLAQAPYIAFLDADDFWQPTYLEEMLRFIERYPACGLYVSAHQVAEKHQVLDPPKDLPEGVLPDYFHAELTYKITRLSSTVVPRQICEEVGGFPVGMVSGEDSYFCGRIAIAHPVAFLTKPLVIYNQQYSGLQDRSFKGDTCAEDWCDLYQPGAFYQNELVAVKALKAGIRLAMTLNRSQSRAIEKRTRYTALFQKKWRYLYFLNRVPAPFILLYKKIKPLLAN